MPWVHHATPEVNSQSHYPSIIAVSVTFCVLMLIVVSVRGIWRRHILGWDDALIALSAVFSVLYTIFCVVETRWGLGLSTRLRPTESLTTFGVLSYAGKPWYQLTLGAYKLALCVGYLRLINGANLKHYKWATISVGAISFILQVVFVLINFFSCMPIHKSWDRSIPGSCLPFPAVQYPIAVVGIVCDVVVFLLPVPLFLKLQLKRKDILGLSILFGCGLITTACSIVRATYLENVGPGGNGDNTMVVLWGTVEANVGIIMSCLPFLRTMFAGMIKRTGASVFGNRTRTDDIQPGYGHKDYHMGTFFGTGKTSTFTTKAERKESDTRSESEDAILAERPQSHGVNGITRTTQIQVYREELSNPYTPGEAVYSGDKS